MHLGSSTLPTVHGDFRVERCQNLFTRNLVLACSRGDLRAPEPLLARVHSSCITSESYGSCDCDCAEQLDAALGHIARAGRGIVFYLSQEGRGAGFTAKVRDRMIVQASGNTLTTFEAYEQMGLGKDHRVYDEVAALRELLGVTAPLRLLTNNPDKLASLADQGVPIAGSVALEHAPSPFNVHYLAAKLDSGHVLNGTTGAARAADLPEPVAYFDPYELPGETRVLHVASYLVPLVVREPSSDGPSSADAAVDGGGPYWFWLHAYFDTRHSRERVVVTHRRDPGAVPLARVQRESLLDRFPLRGGGAYKPAWHATMRAIVRHGAGAVVFVDEDPGVDEITIALLARHVAPRARPLLDAATTTPSLDVGAELARLGVAIEAPTLLSEP